MLKNVVLAKQDKEVAQILSRELKRQNETIILIPSENYASLAVLQATGNIMSNKYAEGYPGKRYYTGCAHIDEIETLAIERAKKLFGAEHANVQTHSGAQANEAVYYALLEPGDTIMGMRLDQGGHLSHGMAKNFSGRYYKVVSYGVRKDTGLIDYDEVRSLALEHKPKLILAGASAYPRVIDFKIFREVADEIGAIFMVDMAHIAGLIAAGVHPSPVPYADVVTSTTHKTLRGPRSGFILCRKTFADKIDKAVFPGLQGGPLQHVVTAKAVCFKEAMSAEYKTYQKQVIKNAKALAQSLIGEGFSLFTGGTDNHLMLVDLHNKNLTGKRGSEVLEDAGITVNRNAIPFDDQPPWITSGLRPGSPSVTARGFKEKEMKQIGKWMAEVINDPENAGTRKKVAKEVAALCKKFPVYKHPSLLREVYAYYK